MNSSTNTGIPPNCKLVFLPSPLFEHIRMTSHNLGNCNNMQGFIFTKRDIEAGEELLWKYNCDQGYRDNCPASPANLVTTPNPMKRGGSLPLSRAPLHPAKAAKSAAVKPIHDCSHHTTCKPGKCTDCKCSDCVANQVQAGKPRLRITPTPFAS